MTKVDPIRSSRCRHCNRRIHLLPLLPQNRAYDAGDGEWQTSYGSARYICREHATASRWTNSGHEPMGVFMDAAQTALAMIEAQDA